MSHLEIFAALFGVVSVYLSTRENIWSWPTAIVNVGLYTVVFYQEKFYADMGLQVVYLALSAYGWFEWLHGGANRGVLRVSRATPRLLLLSGAIIVVGSYTLGSTLSRHTDAVFPYLDSTLTVASLVAQFMMTRKILENWALWVVLDIVYVPMFISRQLYATAALYAVFLVLAVMGYVQWRRSWRAGPPLPALATSGKNIPTSA